MRHRYSAADARRDIAEKTEQEIEGQSAAKWCALALAAFERYERGEGLKWLLEANEFKGEAIEHSSKVMDGGKMVGLMQRRLRKVKA